MPTFFLEPDEIEPERPARSRPVHLVSGGVHPTEAVPLSRQQGPEHPPVAGPCAHCAQPVLEYVRDTCLCRIGHKHVYPAYQIMSIRA